jgi:hypothetical protein
LTGRPHHAGAAGERDLERLLATMRPELREGEYVFVSLPGDPPPGLDPVVTVREPEGTTCVVDRRTADARGFAYDFVAAWIMLSVHSALDAVGLTAAVAARLAGAGISCNVVAGAFHDHLFVPAGRARDALAALR